MKTAKNAKYYIDLVLQGRHSNEEWKRIEKEVEDWTKNCSEAELDEFAHSGAGEALYMVCGAIDIMNNQHSPECCVARESDN